MTLPIIGTLGPCPGGSNCGAISINVAMPMTGSPPIPLMDTLHYGFTHDEYGYYGAGWQNSSNQVVYSQFSPDYSPVLNPADFALGVAYWGDPRANYRWLVVEVKIEMSAMRSVTGKTPWSDTYASGAHVPDYGGIGDRLFKYKFYWDPQKDPVEWVAATAEGDFMGGQFWSTEKQADGTWVETGEYVQFAGVETTFDDVEEWAGAQARGGSATITYTNTGITGGEQSVRYITYTIPAMTGGTPNADAGTYWGRVTITKTTRYDNTLGLVQPTDPPHGSYMDDTIAVLNSFDLTDLTKTYTFYDTTTWESREVRLVWHRYYYIRPVWPVVNGLQTTQRVWSCVESNLLDNPVQPGDPNWPWPTQETFVPDTWYVGGPGDVGAPDAIGGSADPLAISYFEPNPVVLDGRPLPKVFSGWHGNWAPEYHLGKARVIENDTCCLIQFGFTFGREAQNWPTTDGGSDGGSWPSVGLTPNPCGINWHTGDFMLNWSDLNPYPGGLDGGIGVLYRGCQIPVYYTFDGTTTYWSAYEPYHGWPSCCEEGM